MKTTSVCRLLFCLVAVFFTGTVADAEEKDKRPTVAGIVFLTDQQFFQLVQAGYRDAAKDAGINLIQASSKLNLESESRLIDNYTAMGVDAIILSPFHQKKSVPAIKRAHEKGIKVVISCVPLDADFPETTVASNDSQLGSLSGAAARKFIEKSLEGRAKIAVLAFDDREPVQSGMRVDGFLGALNNMPGVRVVTRQNAWASEMSIRVTSDIIAANPDLDLIFAANEGGTAGAVMAVRLAGKCGSIKVFGVDSSQHIASMLLADDNTLQAVSVQQPYEIAVKAIDLTMKLLNNKTVSQKIFIPGFLLTREKKEEVKAYQEYLNKIIN